MREQEYRAAQRREERQHELTMMQMLLAVTQNTAVNTIPTAFQGSNYPIEPGSNSENMHYIGASTYANRRDDNDFFELWKQQSKLRHLGDNIISFIHALRIF